MVSPIGRIHKIKIIIAIAFSFTMIIITSSCEKEGGNKTKISTYGSSESHKAGQNCMSCHQQGGSGEGWFTAAGTVYDSQLNDTYENATVKLYTGPNGTGALKHTIQVDKKGNFYTTELMDFSEGFYTLVEGDVTTNHMISKISNGQCNSCHGSSTDRIWTE